MMMKERSRRKRTLTFCYSLSLLLSSVIYTNERKKGEEKPIKKHE
jgi:hypothetical protein